MIQLTITQKITAGLALLALEVLTIGGYNMWTAREAAQRTAEVDSLYMTHRSSAVNFEREVLNARIHFIYHMTVQKPGALDLGWKRFENARRILPELEKAAQAPQLANLRPSTQQLRSDFETYETQLREIIRLVAEGKNQDDAFKAILATWAKLGGRMVDQAAVLGTESRDNGMRVSREVSEAAQAQVQVNLVVGLVAMLTAIGAAFWLSANIRRIFLEQVARIRATVETVKLDAGRLKEVSLGLGSGASEQAAATEETAASCEEIKAMSARNNENSEAMLARMKNVQGVMATGKESVEQLHQSVQAMIHSNDAITKIVAMIETIAFQTNILALNAAVEAARAGQAGQGFAVVADEVRSLAHRCSEGARQANDIIAESSVNRQSSQQHSEGARGTLVKVQEAIGEVERMAREIRSSSEEQSSGLSQIATAITRIDALSQRTVVNTEQTSRASESLADQALELDSISAEIAASI